MSGWAPVSAWPAEPIADGPYTTAAPGSTGTSGLDEQFELELVKDGDASRITH